MQHWKSTPSFLSFLIDLRMKSKLLHKDSKMLLVWAAAWFSSLAFHHTSYMQLVGLWAGPEMCWACSVWGFAEGEFTLPIHPWHIYWPQLPSSLPSLTSSSLYDTVPPPLLLEPRWLSWSPHGPCLISYLLPSLNCNLCEDNNHRHLGLLCILNV